MRLSVLAPLIEAVLYGPDADVSTLSVDSRKVEPGALFAAIRGTKANGLAFAPMALRNGAVAVLLASDAAYSEGTGPLLRADDVRRSAALAAVLLTPGTRPQVMTAVTGTNGKTSTAVFTRALWSALGVHAASLGSLGLSGPDFEIGSESMTTPDSVTLNRLLTLAGAKGCDRVCLEASSHGLDQRRLDGIVFNAAAFTNLSRDHLDYHRDATEYLAAKSRLFTNLLAADGIAVLNSDDACFNQLRTMITATGRHVWSYGRTGETLRLLNSKPIAGGQAMSLLSQGVRHVLFLPLIGEFQAMNALAAVGLVVATGGDFDSALEAMAGLLPPPGRLELVGTRVNGAAVYVDYAHTPDALETVLCALRPHTVNGKLVCVFGCGGDRDRGKRPLMGAAAQRFTDVAIITDDNPRTEDPKTIRQQTRITCPKALEIGDRSEAIAHAVAMLGPNDQLVVTGKGCEHGQIIGMSTQPFDDREAIWRAIVDCDGAAAL